MPALSTQTGFTQEAFKAFLRSRREPAWLTEQRRESWQTFERLDWPARNDEEWIRTDIRLFKLNQFSPPLDQNPAVDATQPLLIEFYADSCGTCKQLTPTIHKVQEQYKGKATFVMVDVYSKQSFVADLFKIDVIPTLYLFDPKHMQKIEIPSKYLYNETDLSKGIDRGLSQLNTCVANKNALAICRK